MVIWDIIPLKLLAGKWKRRTSETKQLPAHIQIFNLAVESVIMITKYSHIPTILVLGLGSGTNFIVHTQLPILPSHISHTFTLLYPIQLP